MEEHKRAFKGIWIPKEIWEHTDLTPIEKILWAEIDSLDNEEGCVASNEYLAGIMGLSEARITQLITKLKRLKVIEQESFNGRKRTLRSLMRCYESASEELTSLPHKNSLGLYKEEKIDNKKEEVSPVGDIAEKTKSILPVQTEQRESGKIGISSVEKKPLAPASGKLDEKYFPVLSAYKKIMPSVTTKTRDVREGIPRAVKAFEAHFKGEAIPKLIEALLAVKQSDWWKDMIRQTKFGIVKPAKFFSQNSIENTLLPLVLNPPKDDNQWGTPKSEEELREIEDDNARRLQEVMADDRGAELSESGV